MSGDAHVRICESLGVKFPRATRTRGLDRRRDALAVARRRSEWLRSRCPGSASKRHARCPAAHEEPLEIRRHAAARDDHGQAPFVWRCEEEDGPSTRTSSAQRAEQSGGEFPPADKATRTDHEAVQISWTCATISIGSRSGIESLPHSLSRNRHCRLPPRFAPARVRGLARDLQDRRCGLTSPLKKIAFLQPSVRLS